MSSVARVHRGFTLMETLVMLMLVSFAALLMFQTLGNYRIAGQRVLATAGVVDRRALFDAWFVRSVQGLHAVEDVPFAGTAAGFSGLTLNPLLASAGAPTPIGWAIDRPPGGAWTVSYSEAGVSRWSLPVSDADSLHFTYVDKAGARHREWPPALGMQETLPASIILVREGAGTNPVVATVRGPLEPVPRAYQVYED